MNMIPDNTRGSLRESFRKRADERGYISMTRPESGIFLDEMVNDSTVGGIIKQYMADDKVRTYIKDALLNRYMKAKVTPSNDIVHTISKHWFNPKESETIKKFRVTVFDTDDGKVIAVVANFRKYESGLRKLLEFASCRITPAGKKEKIHLALVIHNPYGHTNHGDRATVEKALSYIGVEVLWL